ncbi:M48 family metallopeptidase [Streptomyces zhihengii]
MGTTLRALRALVLLAGLHLLGLLLLVLLAGTGYLLHLLVPATLAATLCLVLLLLAIPVVRGLSMLRLSEDDAVGLPVGEADEPRLWATVREVADDLSTRAPTKIVLTAETAATVTERTRLLGLVGGPLRLHLGAPLLQGLNEGQLRALVAHELGRHATDSRLAALDARCQDRVARTLTLAGRRPAGDGGDEHGHMHGDTDDGHLHVFATGRPSGPAGGRGPGITHRAAARVRAAWARRCLRATLAAAHRRAYAADDTAVRVAGRDATASALRELHALDSAYAYYLHCYALIGIPARTLPPRGRLFGDFGSLLTARQLELVPLRLRPPADPGSAHDPHPPLADRVRRIEALPGDGRADDGTGPAADLLTDPARTYAALEDAVLTPETLSCGRAADWQGLLDAAMTARLTVSGTSLHRATAMYTRTPASLHAVLGVVDDGQLWKLALRMPLSDQAVRAEGRAFREFVRPALRRDLRTMTLAELSARGALTWHFSWAEAASVRLPAAPDGCEHDLDTALDAAVADRPDTAPLRALLAAEPAA